MRSAINREVHEVTIQSLTKYILLSFKGKHIELYTMKIVNISYGVGKRKKGDHMINDHIKLIV